MVNSIFKNIRDKWLNISNQTSEDADRQSYWTDLILAYKACKRNGITVDKKIVKFEQPVKSPTGDNGSIDVYIKQNNNVIIEQKNWNDNLDLKYSRPVASNKNRKVTPLEQALDYNNGFNNDNDKAQYIIISNFIEIRIYDLNNKIHYKKKEIINDSLKPNHVIKLANIGNGSQADKALEAALHGVSIVKKQEIDSHDAAYALDILRLKFIENEQKTMKSSDDKIDYNNVNKYMQFFSMLMFIFYLDDSECFDNHINNNTYRQYHIFRQLLEINVSNFKTIMKPLFTWLGTPLNERDDLLSHDDYGVYTDDIRMFPFVSELFNGNIDFPNIDSEMKQAIINCYASYNWKNVNPVLFGSMMQGLFDDVENSNNRTKLVKTGKRRQLGIHWTPASYIHKAIDPLIINQLTDEVNEIVNNANASIHDLQKLHVELASYRFMDPAAGSGNFITETYLSLRHLENLLLIRLIQLGYDVDINNDVLINVNKQFGAIELQQECDSIMRLQMQIAYIQSILELQDMINNSDFNNKLNVFDELFPLNVDIFKPCIHNALTLDWNDVMPAHSDELLTYSYGTTSNNTSIDYNLKDTYVIGNPPFIGQKYRNREQSNELMQVVSKQYYDGYMDYCVGWYYKAAKYLINTHGSMTYVSTSGIIKSSQAVNVWKPLFNDYKLRIKFAHQKQPWSSEANDATVSIIIVSLKHDYDYTKNESCILYDAYNNCIECEHINNYLINGNDVYVEKTKAPVSKILGNCNRGNGITDGGHLICKNDNEINQAMNDKVIKQHPEYMRYYIVGNDIINSITPPRKILWLVNSTPSDRKKSKFIWNRMQLVIDFRKKSSKKRTQEIAKYPWLFDENRQPFESYIAIPHVFIKNRLFMTCDYYPRNVIIGAPNYYILDPDGFNFSVIESSMIYSWVLTVGGQLGEAPQFNATSTWNTFPMPEINNDDRTAIINAGKRILIARTDNPSILTDYEIKNVSMNDLITILKGERTSTLADLYANGNMPAALIEAHDELDHIIDRIIINYAEDNENAYKELVKNKKTIDNNTRLHYLFKAYEKMTKN